MASILDVFTHTLMITGFVLAMMLVIEYLHVLTGGTWREKIFRPGWSQYAVAALLGVIPGCLGSFTAIALYSHGILSLGAVVAAMIATSGDESFVMLAMIPRDAAVIMAVLLAVGMVAGAVTDMALRRRRIPVDLSADQLVLHPGETCECLPGKGITTQWRRPLVSRAILTGVVTVLILGVAVGYVGPREWDWIRVSILVVAGLSFFVVTTVPDHFLKEHLWNHVVQKHLSRIFLWTLGALVVTHVVLEAVQVRPAIAEEKWVVLVMASLIGLIPESGPHLVFVTLYAEGVIPLSVLLASSMVQDGHGMLPLLAHSRKGFAVVKAINFAVGLTVGAAALALGW
ncbi:MAG: putative manganese transporter [Fidelibacterota bacterium]